MQPSPQLLVGRVEPEARLGGCRGTARVVVAIEQVDQPEGRGDHHPAHHPLEVVVGDPGVATLGYAGEGLAADQLETAAQQLHLLASGAGGAGAQEQGAHGVPVADDALAEREPTLGVLAQVRAAR